MGWPRSAAAVLAALAALAVGCASLPGGGAAQRESFVVQKHSYQEVWTATVRSFAKNFNISDIDQDRGFIEGVRPGWIVGEAVTASISPAGGKPPFTVEATATVRFGEDKHWADIAARDIRRFLKMPSGDAPARPRKSAPAGPLFKEGVGSPAR
jgi:hypothetical protein